MAVSSENGGQAADFRLVRIAHLRCGEWDCTNYVAAPVDWTRSQIDEALWKAQDAYLAAVELARVGQTPPNDWSYRQVPYEDYPDKTVAEVKAEWDAKGEVYKAWKEEQRKTEQKFERFLRAVGFIDLHADGLAVEADCDWGHRHGWPLNYERLETDTSKSAAVFAGAVEYEDEDFG